MAEKGSTSKPKTPKHPPTSKMVEIAILQLKERNGSSLQAIKKFIATNFEVDMNFIYSRMKSYLKQATEEGILINTTGIGASGSFKFSKETMDKMKKEEKSKMKKEVEKGKAKIKDKAPRQNKQTSISNSKSKKTMDVKRKAMPKIKAIIKA